MSISRTRRVGIAAAVCTAALLTGCTGALGSGVRVTGRLVDGETGRPVPRSSVWVHAFNDATKVQVSLEPSDDTDFELRIEGEAIRVRVADQSHTYELYEKTFPEQDGVLDLDVSLVPTHWVRVHGKVLWRDGKLLRPLAEGGPDVRKAMVSAGRSDLRPGADGTYSVKAPRELLKLLTVNTNHRPSPREIDLSAFQGDEFEQDVILGGE